MSKGVNLINLFDPPKSDGHKLILETDRFIIYCPKIKDTVSVSHTSKGTICYHCGKHV